MSENIKNTIIIKYKFADDYNPCYVNGAYGGVGPRGEIVANFYLERQPIPKEETYGLAKGGRISAQPLSREPEDLRSIVIRFIETGVVLNLDSAKKVYSWLGEKIKALEEIQGDKSE